MIEHPEDDAADGDVDKPGLAAAVRAELRRLLAGMLVADFRVHPALGEANREVREGDSLARGGDAAMRMLAPESAVVRATWPGVSRA